MRLPWLAIALLLPAAAPARADDKVDAGTTWFQEKRSGGLGGLTVIHPQIDLGIDLGEHFGIDAGWSADVVSGATAKVYSVDAVSSATTFDDLRNEGNLGIRFAGRRSRLGLQAGVAAERDYLSINFGGSGDIDLPGKNTNFALAYTHHMDQVCDRDNTELTPFQRRTLDALQPCAKEAGLRGQDTIGTTLWHDLTIDTVQAGVTQNLSPTMVGQFSVYGQVLQGFQSNPYRAVRVRNVEAQETIPDVRARAAVSLRLNKYLPAIGAALHADLRGYSDTWGVNSGTFEAAWSQYFGRSLLLRARARIYQQGEAVFFKDAFFYETGGEAGAYFTGDRELGRIRNILLGAKLTLLRVAQQGRSVWGIFDELRFNLKADLLFLDELPTGDPSMNPAGIDGQFLSSGRKFDGFVLQLGLLLRY